MGWNESHTSSKLPDFEIETVDINEELFNPNIDPSTDGQVVPQVADIVELQNLDVPQETKKQHLHFFPKIFKTVD